MNDWDRKPPEQPGAGQSQEGGGGNAASPLHALQKKMEKHLGGDLSGVRVHTGGESAEAGTAFTQVSKGELESCRREKDGKMLYPDEPDPEPAAAGASRWETVVARGIAKESEVIAFARKNLSSATAEKIAATLKSLA